MDMLFSLKQGTRKPYGCMCNEQVYWQARVCHVYT